MLLRRHPSIDAGKPPTLRVWHGDLSYRTDQTLDS